MSRSGHAAPERFQAKWRPVRVKKTRQTKNLEPRFDSIEAEKALAAAQLSAGQRKRNGPEYALGFDQDGLLVAARGQRNVRGESRRTGDHLKIAVAAMASEVSADIAGAFAPGPGKRAAFCDEIAGEIEFVSVAGAGQALIEAGAASADGVSRATANPFGRSIVERDGAAARPAAGHAC